MRSILQDVTFLTGGYPAPYINRTSSVLQVTQREGGRKQSAAGRRSGSPAPGRSSKVRSSGQRVVDGVGAAQLPRPVHRRHRHRRRAGVVHAQRARPSTTCHRGNAIWVVNIAGVDEIRLGLTEASDLEDEMCQLRHPVRRMAQRHRLQLAASVRVSEAWACSVSGIPRPRSTSKCGTSVLGGLPFGNTPVDEIIGRSPEVYRENSREGESAVEYDLTAFVLMFEKVQVGGSFKVFRVQYDCGFAFRERHSILRDSQLRSLLSQPRLHRPGQTGAYAQSTRVPDAAPQCHGRRPCGSLRLPVDGRDSARGPARACGSATRCRGTRAPGRTTSGRGSFSCRRFRRTRRSCRGAPTTTSRAWPGRPTGKPSGDGRGVPEDVHRLPRGERPAQRVAGEHGRCTGERARAAACPAHERGRGGLRGRGIFYREATRLSAVWPGQPLVSRTRHAGLDRVLRPGSFDYPIVFNLVGGYRLSPVWGFCARLWFLWGQPSTPYDQAVSTTQRRAVYRPSRASTPNERQPTAASTFAWTAPLPWRAASEPVRWARRMS